MNMMIGAYPRNEDGSVKRKQPCADCDWPNWHVCPKRMGPDTFSSLVRRKSGLKSYQQLAYFNRLNAHRDAEIIRRYRDDQWGYQQIMDHFKIGKNQTGRVLKEAEARGELVIRKPGQRIDFERQRQLVDA